MKTLTGSLLIIFLLGCGANGNSKVFDGTWVDTKNPNNVWKFESSFSGVKGVKISGEDASAGLEETWKITTKQDVIIGTSTSTEGSSLAYFPERDEILITPPGILFKRKK